MLKGFSKSLDEGLRAAPISSEARAQIAGQSGDLVNMKIPDGVSGEAQASIRQTVRVSFVAGFRLVAYVAAGLAPVSALSSWLLIEGKARSESGMVVDDERGALRASGSE